MQWMRVLCQPWMQAYKTGIRRIVEEYWVESLTLGGIMKMEMEMRVPAIKIHINDH
jgi:hypothetical protein